MSHRSDSSAEVPNWLSEESISTAASIANNPAFQKAAKNAAKTPAVQQAVLDQCGITGPWSSSALSDEEKGTDGVSVAATALDEERKEMEMGKYHLALRICYVLAASFMAVSAALSLSGQKNLGEAFFGVYVIFFAVLICCFECALSVVARILAVNFGFMYTSYGRVIFIVLVSFMSYTLGFLGILSMAAMVAVLLYHGFVMWKFPQFEDYLRKKHYYEGRREAANK